MANKKWFERQFKFNTDSRHFPKLLQRLQHASAELEKKVSGIAEIILEHKPKEKWSIKEHTGHLFIMEPLWRKRLIEIKEGKSEMSPADLNNTATTEALFNRYAINELIEKFAAERKETVLFLQSLQPADFKHSLFHPRLQQAMHITDLMYFVAEHDLHHLNAIEDILRNKE